jgi:cell division protein DivIC
VLDTTHGFRHQPMLLAPMVVLLGMLKNLSGVELYYGALDMRQRDEPSARVLKLDLFPELLEYIQYLSVLQTSGDYEPLSEILIEESQTRHQLREIAFLERVNHPVDYEDVQRLMETIDLSISSNNPLKHDLLNTLQETLRKYLTSSDLDRMVARADFAKEHKDYLVAYTLLYEAIITIAMQHFDSDAFNQLCKKLGTDDSKTLRAFRKVRNSIVHADPVLDDKRAEEALQSEQGIIDLYDEVRQIFAKLRDTLST